MSRRPTLPGADELFRTTTGELSDAAATPSAAAALVVAPALTAVPATTPAAEPAADHDVNSGRETSAAPGVRRSRRPRRGRAADHRPSGCELHEEKITVYLSPEELMDLERARMDLFGANGLKVDRGRIVRESVAIVLADLEAKGDSSILVRRLLDT
jgi:hypothetical protein